MTKEERDVQEALGVYHPKCCENCLGTFDFGITIHQDVIYLLTIDKKRIYVCLRCKTTAYNRILEDKCIIR